MSEMTGAQILIKALRDQGVDVVFGYPGGAVLPIYDALFQQNHVRHILVRHEQAAVHAAEGYARSTGKIGVVLVTSGPGATNTITGLTDALMDSIPIVCITGQVATHLIGSDAFQEADTTGLTRSCTKHNYLVKEIGKLEHTIHEAFYIAKTGRPGPVVVDLPKNIQLQSHTYKGLKNVTRKSHKAAPEPNEAKILEAMEVLAKSKRPVFYTGGGVVNAGDEASKLLTEFIRLLGAPCTSTLMGLGAFPASDPQFLKMLGMHGTYEANMAMAECDVMVNVGARFDDRVTGRLDAFSVGSKKIHVDVDASSINKTVHADFPLVGDAAETLKIMLKLWKKHKFKLDKKALDKWWEQIERWRGKKSLAYRQKGSTIKPQYALDRLNTILGGKDAFVSTDVGQHQMWSAQYLGFEKPRRWLTSGGLGTMGYGLPAIIGAQIGNPNKPCVCVTGEASFLMNIQELNTAVQFRLPIKILILNNHYMGMVRQWQELFHGNRHSESYMDSLPDFVKLAESFHMKGLRCDNAADVDDALKAMLAHNGPVILDMCVDQNENVYPMIPAGAAHYEMKLSPTDEVDVDEEEARMQV